MDKVAPKHRLYDFDYLRERAECHPEESFIKTMLYRLCTNYIYDIHQALRRHHKDWEASLDALLDAPAEGTEDAEDFEEATRLLVECTKTMLNYHFIAGVKTGLGIVPLFSEEWHGIFPKNENPEDDNMKKERR